MKKKMPTSHLQLSNKDTVAKSEYTINVNSAESVNLAIAVSALGQRFKFASARKHCQLHSDTDLISSPRCRDLVLE